MKTIVQLYAEFGQAMLQLEIIQRRTNLIKQQIQEVLNQSVPEDFKEVKVPEKKESQEPVKSAKVIAEPKKIVKAKKKVKKKK